MSLFSAPSDTFQNSELNALASDFARDFGHDEQQLIQRVTNRVIFDAAPKQFFDLKLLNMRPAETTPSDEFFYNEAGYQRSPLVATGTASAVSHPTTQTFALQSVDNISKDTLIVYSDNSKGNVLSVNLSAKEITVAPLTNNTLPAVSANDEFGNVTPIEADAAEGFSQSFRLDLIERSNFVQLMSKSYRFGRAELHKLNAAGTFDDYVGRTRKEVFRQFRIDMSNTFWNGEKGETILSNGDTAKLAGGVFPIMVAAGSPNTAATTVTLKDAFEDMILESEFQDFGDIRFAFMSNRLQLTLSKQYKDDKTRYRPDDEIAKLGLNMVDIGSSRIVLIPFDRFRDRASFPSAFENRIMILDMETIRRKQMWGEMSGETLDRTGGIAKTFKDFWVEGTFSIEMRNPLASAFLDVTL